MKTDKLIYGIQTINVILDSYPESVVRLLYKKSTANKRIHDTVDNAKQLGVTVDYIQDTKYLGKHHQPLMAQCKSLPKMNEHDLENMAKADDMVTFLILDGISDPHNLGAILRTAAGMGVHAVILPKRNTVSLTPTVRNVACGGAEIVPIFHVGNLARTIRMLKSENVWIYGADVNSDSSLQTVKFPPKIALVFGNEHDGLKHLTRQECDEIISIPLTQAMDSLNVSVAAGMFMYQVMQRD